MSELLTKPQLAERLQVSTRTVENLMAAGKITPAINEGKTLRFIFEDVLAELKPKKKSRR